MSQDAPKVPAAVVTITLRDVGDTCNVYVSRLPHPSELTEEEAALIRSNSPAMQAAEQILNVLLLGHARQVLHEEIITKLVVGLKVDTERKAA